MHVKIIITVPDYLQTRFLLRYLMISAANVIISHPAVPAFVSAPSVCLQASQNLHRVHFIDYQNCIGPLESGLFEPFILWSYRLALAML
jgi:hypothetical protein